MNVARGLLAAFVLTLTGSALGQDSGAERVVVRAGGSTASASELSRRIAQLGALTRAELGKSADEVRRKFAENVVGVELQYAEEARRQQLQASPALQIGLRRILGQALELELRRSLDPQRAVSEAEVRAFYEANRARFNVPRRLRIWRVLVSDRALAERILREARGPKGPERWASLAREHSLDKATHMRSGDLGFVRQDGTTDVPQVRAEPSLFALADQLEDGELASEPIAEGANWALVWRRGSLPAVTRSFEQERGPIRELLLRRKLEQAWNQLIGELRTKHVSALSYEPLESLPLDAFGTPAERARPAILPNQRARPTPAKTDRGLR